MYLKKIPYLCDMIDNLRTSGEWKIDLIIKINFASTTAPLEYHMMPLPSTNDNPAIMIGFDTD